MANDPAPPCKYFNLTYPVPFVAHVEINRPEKMNAFIEDMWHELPPLFTHLSASPSTRAIVLSGAGPHAFTVGLDLRAAAQNPALFPPPPQGNTTDVARTATRLRRHIDAFQSCLTAIASCQKPVLAAVHGWCLGLGVDIALCADVRFCAPDARFAVKEVDVGIAADVGTLSRLPKVVGGGSWVKDVCLSGRVFGAVEAERVGFVSLVAAEGAVLGEAVRWAAGVAAKSPVAVLGTKEVLDWGWARVVEDGLRYTSVWNAAMLQSADVREAMLAGLEKRKPGFAKL